MGRGRAKAKQAKVARQLKYSGSGTDLDALRRELLGGASPDTAGFDGAADDSADTDEDDEDFDSDDDFTSEDNAVDTDDEFGPESYRAGGSR